MKRKKWIAFLVCLALFLLVWALKPRERMLLEIATRVVGRKEFALHCWRNNQEIVLLDGGNPYYEATLLNVSTRQRTKLTDLDKRLKFNIDRFISSSPDGKWLLCSPFDGEWDVNIVTLDGAQAHTWSVGGNLELYWIPGTSHWIRLIGDGYGPYRTLKEIEVCDVNHPSEKQRLPVTPTVRLDSNLLGATVTPDRLFLLLSLPDGQQSSDLRLEIVECRIEPSRIVPVHTYHPGRFSRSRELVEIAIAPQGDRMAVVYKTQTATPWWAFLKRLFPSLSVEPKEKWWLTLSRLDGTEMREIGVTEKGLGSLQWRPDGKALSFIYYAGDLYTIAVD